MIRSFYKKELIHLRQTIGNQALNNIEIDKYCKKYLGKEYMGCYSQDNIPLNRLPSKCMFIFNNDISTGQGIHWLACFKQGKTYYVYDSFGRRSTSLLPIFVKQVIKSGSKIKDSDYSKEQSDYQEDCGIRSIAFLICVRKFGINRAIQI
jgi:hypothetical protein